MLLTEFRIRAGQRHRDNPNDNSAERLFTVEVCRAERANRSDSAELRLEAFRNRSASADNANAIWLSKALDKRFPSDFDTTFGSCLIGVKTSSH